MSVKHLIFLASSVLLFACNPSNEQQAESANNEPVKNHVAVYDFHTDHRCETCLAIEKATKETLNKHFKSQLDDETITFALYNADDEKNATLAEKYTAFGTTLAITIFKDGKEEIIDITNWAFEAVHGDNFESELKTQLTDALEKL
jgi:hypothetical protein